MNEYGKQVKKQMDTYIDNPDSIDKEISDIQNATHGVEVRGALAAGVKKSFDKSVEARDITENLLDGSYDQGLLNTEIENRMDNLYNTKGQAMDELHDAKETELDNLKQEYADKATTLETTYAPRLTSIETEIEDARGGETNLGDRLNEFSSQLAQTEEQVNIRSASIPFGEIKIPNDFAEVPFNLWRDRDGLIKHDYDLNQFDNADEFIYVDPVNGLNTNQGVYEENPVKTLSIAIDKANNLSESHVTIVVKGNYFFDRVKSVTTEKTITDKILTIKTDNEDTYFWAGNGEDLTWTKTSGQSNVYQANRTNSSGILDKRKLNLDHNGIPKPYKKVTSIAECETTEGSWFFDGSIIYTHTIGAIEPDNEDIFGLTRVASFPFKLNNSTLVIKNAYLYNGGAFDGINVTGDINSKFILDNVKSFHNNYFNNDYTTVGNGIATIDVGQTLLFNVTTAYGNRDGFNYHYTGIPIADRRKCLAFEYNCTAYDYGVHDLANTNDNATTMHEGACVLRVGTIGYRTRGPVLADVNASYSINYDVHMRDSLSSPTANAGKNKVAMKFHTGGAPEGFTGKTILVNCSGGGDVNWGLYRDGDVDTEFTIQGFKGAGLVNVDTLKILS